MKEHGKASWYSYPGKKTASGERMTKNRCTCAHKTLAFGTKVHIINEKNGRTVVATVNDRGPFVRGRIIDLSYASAKALDVFKYGVVPVTIVW